MSQVGVVQGFLDGFNFAECQNEDDAEICEWRCKNAGRFTQLSIFSWLVVDYIEGSARFAFCGKKPECNDDLWFWFFILNLRDDLNNIFEYQHLKK